MHRQTVYPTANPRSEDFLRAQQNTMTAFGALITALFGTNTVVDGFTLTPSLPASMTVNLGPGSVYEVGNVEASAWSILPADTHTTMKQGILQDPAPLTFVAPGTQGYAQNYLVQVQYQDLDDTPVLLQYYNSLDPKNPIFGAGGNGLQQNTRRAGIVAIQAKAGISATAGSQTIPTPDAGWVGLFVITLTYGQTAITAGNIAPYQFAPFIFSKLPQVPAAVQNQAWTYFVDQGTANAAVIVPQPAAVSWPDGQSWHVRMAAPNTGASTISINGTAFPIVKGGAQTACAGGEWGQGDLVRFTKVGAAMQIQVSGGSAGLTLMTSNTTFNVPSTQYPSIQAAVLAAGQIFISPNALLTIAVAAGWIERLTAATGPIILNHPHGQRIQIVAAALNGAFPVRGDIVGKTPANILSFLQGRFSVQVQAIGTDAWQLQSGFWGLVSGILTVCDGTNSGGHYGWKIGTWSTGVGFGAIALQNCWTHGSGLDNYRAEQSSALQVNNVGSTCATRGGFWVSHYSTMECNFGSILSYYNMYGAASFNDGLVAIDSASGQIDLSYNSSHGIYCPSFGKFNALVATGVTLTNNGGWGAYAFGQSQINLPSSTSFGSGSNATGDLCASLSSVVTALGATVGTCSPAKNQIGNNNSIVIV